MLEPILDETRIGSLVRRLDRELRVITPRTAHALIGYHGGNSPLDIRWGPDLWYGYADQGSHYWNPFGLEYRHSGTQMMTVQINPDTDGRFLHHGGLFAEDPANGNIYYLHNGRLAGGRKGISQKAFLGWYKGRRLTVRAPDGSTRELIRVATLGSSRLPGDIVRYVTAVAEFKDEVTSKNKKPKKARKPGHPSGKSPRVLNARRSGLPFRAKSYGRRRVRKAVGRVVITRSHDAVVNALAEWVERQFKAKTEIYDNQMVDLGLYGKRGVKHVFEVKTSLNTQPLYTGVGQLMMHSSGKTTVAKTLVLPKSGRVTIGPDWMDTLGRLNVNLLWYRKARKKYDFFWDDSLHP